MVQAVKEDLLRVGCPEESAQSAEHRAATGQIGDALRQMKVIHCGLMDGWRYR